MKSSGTREPAREGPRAEPVSDAAVRDWFAHPAALVESSRIGRGTRVWAFAHILPGAVIGADCNICDGVFVENDVVVGDRVTVKCGVQLWDGVTLEDDVFVGPNATFTNDPFPRSRQYPAEFPRTIVRRGASIGANATILPGLVISANAMVGAGAVVTADVPPNAVVVGNPARVVRFVDGPHTPPSRAPKREESGVRPLRVARGALISVPVIRDRRGALSVAEVGAQLPFVPQRYFAVTDVPAWASRGGHAHRALHEFLICLRGRVRCALDDGSSRDEVALDSPAIGLHMPPLLWGVQFDYSSDATLLVLASDVYDETDYITDYDEFLQLVSGA